MEVPNHLVIDILLLSTGIGGLIARQKGWEKRLTRLEDTYVPRPEIENALAGIEKSVIQLHGLMEAFVSSGRRGLDLDAAGEPIDYIEDYITHDCPRFEGSVPWMYLDTEGLVTCAIGNMLPDAAAACRLPFRDASGNLASSQQIADDFARVHAMEKGHLPEHYRSSTSPALLPADILALNRQRCYTFDAELRATFPWFTPAPNSVKKAVLDMVFNLGLGRYGPPATGFHEFGHLIEDLEAGDYQTAAINCARNAHDPAFNSRNLYTRSLFESAGAGV